MKKIIKIFIGLFVVILIVAGAVTLVKKRKQEDAKIPTAKIYPLVVQAIEPTKGHITTTLKYLAMVKNDKNVLINSKFAGKI